MEHAVEKDAGRESLRCRLGIHRYWDHYGAGGVEPARIRLGHCIRCGRVLPPGSSGGPDV